MAVQVSVTGSGAEHARPVVILEPGLSVEGVPRAATPAEAVELAIASVA